MSISKDVIKQCLISKQREDAEQGGVNYAGRPVLYPGCVPVFVQRVFIGTAGGAEGTLGV